MICWNVSGSWQLFTGSRAKSTAFWLLSKATLCLLTPWPWKHKCVLDEGLVMEKLGQCVSTTLCRQFQIILHKDLTPRSCLFQMLTNSITVTPTVLSKWRLGGSYLGGDRESDWVGHQDEKGDCSGHLKISKTLTNNMKEHLALYHHSHVPREAISSAYSMKLSQRPCYVQQLQRNQGAEKICMESSV